MLNEKIKKQSEVFAEESKVSCVDCGKEFKVIRTTDADLTTYLCPRCNGGDELNGDMD
jgi:Zn finger protein HypA/HybF involved in hydrogenase expression